MEHTYNVELAKKYGVDAAIIIRHFQYWIIYNRERGNNLIDGRTWTYFALSSLKGIFPYWTHKQLRRIVNHLLDAGVLLKENHNKKPYDKTRWYAFADEPAFLNEKAYAQMGKSMCPNGQMDVPKRAHGCAQTGKPIPNPKPNELTYNLTNPIGLNKSSEKVLELDLQIAKEKKFFCEQIERIFRLNNREKKTFASVIAYLIRKCQAGELPVSIFKDAIEWARQAAVSNAANKKGLFIAKIKEKTGFAGQKQLLKV